MTVVSVISCALWALIPLTMYGPMVARWHRGYGSASDMVYWICIPAFVAILSVVGPLALRRIGRRRLGLALAIICLVAWFPPAFLILGLAAI
jgi:TctA family transporter